MSIIRVISAWTAMRVVDFVISVAAVFVWFSVYFAFISFAGEGKGFCENTNLCSINGISINIEIAIVSAIYFFTLFLYLPITILSNIIIVTFFKGRSRVLIDMNVYIYAAWATVVIIFFSSKRVIYSGTFLGRLEEDWAFLTAAVIAWIFGVAMNYLVTRKAGRLMFAPD